MSIFGKIIETYAYFNITMGLAVPIAYDESYHYKIILES